jgi:hypothetical protein
MFTKQRGTNKMLKVFDFKNWIKNNGISITAIGSVMYTKKTSYFDFIDEFKEILITNINQLVIDNLNWYDVSLEQLNKALEEKTLIESISNYGQVFGFDQKTISEYIAVLKIMDLDVKLSSSPINDIVVILANQSVLYKMKHCKKCIEFILKD